MIHSFPKIFTLGQSYIHNIWNGDVEITEKIDGSQFAFGNIKGELWCRTKGTIIHGNIPDKMFKSAVAYCQQLFDSGKLPEGFIFYAEYLHRPKHNVLAYGSIPKNNFALFGVFINSDHFKNWVADSRILKKYADALDIDVAPLLYRGKLEPEVAVKMIDEWLKEDSYLGGAKIEGIVVKNYSQAFLLGGQPIPFMAGKFVSEAFKEVHVKNWKKEHSGKGRWEVFKEQYRTEARWIKSIQHLKEMGALEDSPRDIGKLILEIKNDIASEQIETIKSFLWNEFGSELLRTSTHGFPEFYKRYLLQGSVHESSTVQ